MGVHCFDPCGTGGLWPTTNRDVVDVLCHCSPLDYSLCRAQYTCTAGVFMRPKASQEPALRHGEGTN